MSGAGDGGLPASVSVPDPVAVVDRVVLPGGEVDGWLVRWRAEYVPGAQARGLRGPRVWHAHAGADSVELTVVWTLPDSSAFFRMRGLGGADEAVAAFWAWTDALAVHRDRRVLRRPGDGHEAGGTGLGGAYPGGNDLDRGDGLNTADGGAGAAAHAVASTTGTVRWIALTAPGSAPVAGWSGGADLPGCVGGLGMSWDTRTGAGASPEAVPGGPGADLVALQPALGARAADVPAGPRIKRTLLLSVYDDADAASVARFEREVLAMPEHVRSIRGWSLARVDQARTPSGWTHVWEQEFADLSGLTGEYLRHPYHWTCVDRWFDAEMPGRVVRPRLAHVFREADGPVLAG